MADLRIRVAKNKTEFMKELVPDERTTGPFRLQADAVAFAAALGANRNCHIEGFRVPANSLRCS